jgi:hypothetical protein
MASYLAVTALRPPVIRSRLLLDPFLSGDSITYGLSLGYCADNGRSVPRGPTRALLTTDGGGG